MSIYGIGLGLGTQNSNGEWLEVFYPDPILEPEQGLADIFEATLGATTRPLTDADLDAIVSALNASGNTDLANIASSLKGGKGQAVYCTLTEDSAPVDVPSAYFALHAISHRLVKPHGIKLDGIFGILPNVAWTSEGAIDLEELTARQIEARSKGQPLVVNSVDKFPRMTDYVVPSGVRIGDASRIRLGAYLGEGTTVMHEGFINFNAGCEGPNMIEGRISAGVFVGSGSDLGGGSSTMGTLSGGGNITITLGKDCLLGANAGTGIPLGDRCTIESGLYITAGTKVTVLDDNQNVVNTVKAASLIGKDDLLFRRNSVNGAVECLTNKSAIVLNSELHSNN